MENCRLIGERISAARGSVVKPTVIEIRPTGGKLTISRPKQMAAGTNLATFARCIGKTTLQRAMAI